MPRVAISTPASAGPSARATLTPIDDRDAASAMSGRGTISGTMAWYAGSWMAAAVPRPKVSASSSVGVMRPLAVTMTRARAMRAWAACTPISSRLRFMNSPRTPAGMPNSSTGAAEAVETSAMTAGEEPCSTRNHCAPTVCIQLPMLLMTPAIQSQRKIGTARGANAPEDLSEVSLTASS